MAKVILICGKICSGKSTYAEELCREKRAALLSVDEIMLALFGQHCGDKHDAYTEKTQAYLFEKSVKLIENGIDVILDWGFWQKAKRAEAKAFFESRDIVCELHYIDVCDEIWRARINKRNEAVLAGKTDAYFVDDNLAAKFEARFEMPSADEIDVWVSES